MKNSVACLFLVSLFSANGALAESVVLSDIDDLVIKSENNAEVVYTKDGKLYSGAVVQPDEQNRQLTYFYSNGKKHGVAFSRFSDGKMEYEVAYANGKKNGEEVLFYPNGEAQYKVSYKDDIKNGEEIIFYQNGKPQKRCNYENGELNGETYYFDENGDVTKIETYKKGIKNGKEKIIAKNVLLEENQYVDGLLNGTSKKFSTKYLTDEIEFVNGKKEGLHKKYESNGARMETPYKNDKKEGEAKIYYPGGAVSESVVYSNDKRNGVHKKFDLGGKLVFAVNYKDDLKDGIAREFDDKHKLTTVSYYVDDVKLAEVDINKRNDLKNILQSIEDKQLDKYSNKRNLWYKILWLGLNTENPEIIETLEKEMKMYAVDVNDMRIYKRYSGSQFESETKQLFFGLNLLDYAINLEAPGEILQKFINQIADKNSAGDTPLRDAVRLNKTAMVKFLLLNNADLTERDNEGNDILLYAIVTNSPLEMIQDIIRYGADVNTSDGQNQTPLTIAIAQKNVELVKLLLRNNAKIEKRPDGQELLYYAYDKKAQPEMLKVLLDNGQDINSADAEGNNLLLRALKDNNEEVAEFALENNADVNQQNNDGETAVSYVLFNKTAPEIFAAVFDENYDFEHKLQKPNKMVWKILMEQNKLDLLKKTWDKMPDVSSVADENKEIPVMVALNVANNPQLHELALSYIKKIDEKTLWQALISKDFELFTVLLGKQANINAQNDDGDSLLSYMIKNDYERKFLDALQSEDLIINAENKQRQTALDIALAKDNLKDAEYLLEAGANPNRATDGETYITKATPLEEKQVRLLMKYVKNFDTKLPNNESLLMRAVKNLNLPLFEYLSAQKDADFNIKDDNGNSLLLGAADHFAACKNAEDEQLSTDNFITIAKVLLKNGADINLRNGNGETLLIKLAKNCKDSYDALAKFVINNGADTEMKDQYNKKAADYRTNTEATDKK